MERLTYSSEIESFLHAFAFKVRGQFLIDYRYLHFHNDVCPKCKRKMKLSGNVVENATSISFFNPPMKKVLIPYTLCPKCFKYTKTKGTVKVQKNKTMDEYILSKIDAC